MEFDEFSDARLGVWDIRAWKSTDILNAYPYLEELYANNISIYRSAVRQLEKLATYALMYEMIGEPGLHIAHNEAGKPILKDWHVSISHTKGYVAVLLSAHREVAVDIEIVGNRVERIAERFIRQDEVCETLASKLICWSIKETVYKYFSEQELAFFDMRLLSFQTGNDGIVTVENLKAGTSVQVSYRLTPHYVLSYI